MTQAQILAAALLAATATVTASAYAGEPDADFGDAVRNMVDAQIQNPEAALHPPEFAPQELDGERAAAALKLYREQASKPAKTQQPLNFSLSPR